MDRKMRYESIKHDFKKTTYIKILMVALINFLKSLVKELFLCKTLRVVNIWLQ